MQHLVGYAQNNIGVYVNLIQSEAARHIAHEPHLLALAAEVLQGMSLDAPIISVEYNMKRIIGYDFVIATTDTSSIFYAQLVRDTSYTRFTKNGKPSPTQYLSIMLNRSHDGTSFSLHDVWIGRLVPPKPGSTEETTESRTYWKNHALLFDNQPVQSRTLTKICPY